MEQGYTVDPAAAGKPEKPKSEARDIASFVIKLVLIVFIVRSLIFSLAMFNPAAFHRKDAAGYVFWADQVLALDAINPQVAGRLARVMDRWTALAEPYRGAAREAIARVAAKPDLSNDVREIVQRALALDPRAASAEAAAPTEVAAQS